MVLILLVSKIRKVGDKMTNIYIYETSANPTAPFSIPFTLSKLLTIATVVTSVTLETDGVKKNIDFNELIDVSKVSETNGKY